MKTSALTLHFTTLTPLHVGAGQWLGPFDLVQAQQKDHFHLLDFERWLEEPESLLSAGRLGDLAQLQARLWPVGGAMPPTPPPRAVIATLNRISSGATHNPLKDALAKAGPGGVRAAQREVDGRFRLPGSTIKGMLQTAWLWQINQNRQKEVFDTGRFQDSPFSTVSVSDAAWNQRDGLLAEVHRIHLNKADFSLGDRPRGRGAINMGWTECVPPGASTLVSVTVREDLFAQRRRGKEGNPVWNIDPYTTFAQALAQALAEYAAGASRATNLALAKVNKKPIPAVAEGCLCLPLGLGGHNFTRCGSPFQHHEPGWATQLATQQAIAKGPDAKQSPWSAGRHTLQLVRSLPPARQPAPAGWTSARLSVSV